MARISAVPPVPGIEPLLVENGEDPQTAHLMALFIVGLGERWVTERVLIERPLASELRHILRCDRIRQLNASRARALQKSLDRDEVVPIIQAALDRAGLSLSSYALREITAAASGKDRKAWDQLVEISTAVLPYLCDPRGRRMSAGTGIHLFLQCHLERSYTWSDENGDFTDPLTRATREFLGKRRFNPKAANRLYRKQLISEDR